MNKLGIVGSVIASFVMGCSAPAADTSDTSEATSASTSSAVFPLEGTYTLDDNSCLAFAAVGTTFILTSDKKGVSLDEVTSFDGQTGISPQLPFYAGDTVEQELGIGKIENRNRYSSGHAVFTAATLESQSAGQPFLPSSSWVFKAGSGGSVSVQELDSSGAPVEAACRLVSAPKSPLQDFAKSNFDGS
jgi:hypothetical protein